MSVAIDSRRNVVCFPDGIFYGHVTEESAKLIVKESHERGSY